MAYFGGIFFANMGGGSGQNYSHRVGPRAGDDVYTFAIGSAIYYAVDNGAHVLCLALSTTQSGFIKDCQCRLERPCAHASPML